MFRMTSVSIIQHLLSMADPICPRDHSVLHFSNAVLATTALSRRRTREMDCVPLRLLPILTRIEVANPLASHCTCFSNVRLFRADVMPITTPSHWNQNLPRFGIWPWCPTKGGALRHFGSSISRIFRCCGQPTAVSQVCGSTRPGLVPTATLDDPSCERAPDAEIPSSVSGFQPHTNAITSASCLPVPTEGYQADERPLLCTRLRGVTQ